MKSGIIPNLRHKMGKKMKALHFLLLLLFWNGSLKFWFKSWKNGR